jgi:hypothetical protein
MKVQIILIDWEYPEEKEIPKPEIWDLKDRNDLMSLYLAFANGIIVELRAIGESEEVIKVIRGLAQGAGACQRVELTPEKRAKVWLYQEGDESYIQGDDFAYIFIDPNPRPENFLFNND